ncbi:PEP-CTERM sorting domain-containing protein [Nodosilinea sp. FACHB-131]|uniref:PEP-CTERM sorting domain-containing protein n=1 Tax=Cyanophyceae TaxID=3028117 RepID=UPI001681D231|nr:PEP-CTERM sorting domain-containing protein [Nodosilinea sp. FACHB-131]MBD1876821.1 PEP-CTERM sorting domain-containing protein [Nodosilinea sp. FACHB-131]
MPSSFIGSLAFAPSGNLFTMGFNSASEIGSILKYKGPAKERSLLADASPELQRPIGILYAAQPVPEPLTLGGLAIAAGGLMISRRRR